MSLWKYKYFLDVVELKSFTKAGARNYVTQTAVSQQIASLEKMAGGTQLERGNGEICLTELGEIVYEYAREMVQTHEVMLHEIERYKENDYDSPFGIQFSCDHISAMPEAESISYFDISNGESLYFNGVTQVSIDSDSPQPRFYSEKKGKFSSEKDALNSINKNLDSYGLSRYNLKPFSWDSKESNLLIVNEDNNISCSFKIVGNSDSNSKSGLCYIEPNGSNK